MRAERQRFCNSGAGMEIFALSMAYEISLSACYKVSIALHDQRSALISSQSWKGFFSRLNNFMERIVPRTRHFDVKFWTLFQAIQPRTEAAVDKIFWVKSLNPTPNSPVAGTARSPELLTLLSDAEYIAAYREAKRPESLKYRLRVILAACLYLELCIGGNSCMWWATLMCWVGTLTKTRFNAITLGNSLCVQVGISLTSSGYPDLTVLDSDFGLDIASGALAFMQHTRLRQGGTRLPRVNVMQSCDTYVKVCRGYLMLQTASRYRTKKFEQPSMD
jgi:hypothetical protein